MDDSLEYSQPDFYKFNEDSIKLVEFTASCINDEVASVLDIGCGCGILGIELALRKSVKSLHLLEVQSDFEEHINENLEKFKVRATISFNKFSSFEVDKKYDLIISNPPYFNRESSRPSPNFKKDACRSFRIDSFIDWLNCIKRNMSQQGEVFLVLRKENYNVLKNNTDFKIISTLEDKNIVFIHLCSAKKD